MKNCLLFIFALYIFTGCTLLVAKGDYFTRDTIPPVNDEMATIFVYRTGYYRTGIEHGIVNMFLNEDIIFGAVHNGYTWFYLKPGNYEFKSSWTVATKPLFEGGLFDDKKLELTVEKAKRYYVSYQVWDSSSQSTYSRFGLIGKMLEPKKEDVYVTLTEESEERGIRQLEDCRLQKNNLNKMN